MKGRRLTVGLAALAALPLLYVAAYLALMQRMTAFPGRGVWVEYRVGGPVAEVIFAPANYLDRRMRPAYWDYWTLRGEIQYYAPGPDFVSGP